MESSLNIMENYELMFLTLITILIPHNQLDHFVLNDIKNNMEKLVDDY